MISNRIKIVLVSLLAMLPTVAAYTSGPTLGLLNLWDLLVEQMFGAFWPAVLFLMVIFFILLMMGGISLYTNIIFQVYFLFAMAIGYGYSIFIFPVLLGSFIYCAWQIIKWIGENR